MPAYTNKINDFGDKIGGARKDVWGTRGLMYSDLMDMNDYERDENVIKKNIWDIKDWKKLKEEGYDPTVLYWIKTVKDNILVKPALHYYGFTGDIEGTYKTYIDTVTQVRDTVMAVKTKEDFENFQSNFSDWQSSFDYNTKNLVFNRQLFYKTNKSYETVFRMAKNHNWNLFTPEEIYKTELQVANCNDVFSKINEGITSDYVELKFKNEWTSYTIRIDTFKNGLSNIKGDTANEIIEYIENNPYILWRNISLHNDNFFISAYPTLEEAEKKKAELVEQFSAKDKENGKDNTNKKKKYKTSLTPPQLSHIDRTGVKFIEDGYNVTGDDFINVFKIKGGEFGNWNNTNDRQTNLNMAFNAFKDIAFALNISDEDISLGNRLNIAWGSRGRAGALAHYEPARNVINLTKMKGAGSLAHEYFHALDNICYNIETENEKKYVNYKKPFCTENSGLNSFNDLVYSMQHKRPNDEELFIWKQEQKEEAFKTLVVDNLLRCMSWDFKKKYIANPFDRNPDCEDDLEIMENWDKVVKDFCDKAVEIVERGGHIYQVVPCAEYEAFAKTLKEEFGADNLGNSNCKIMGNLIDRFAQKVIYIESRTKDQVTIDTNFYKDAKALDDAHTKSGVGYWSSNCEMGARAFACYIADKLAKNGYVNDYLTGHSDYVPTIAPHGEEREVINQHFDKCIEDLKECGILHEREERDNMVLHREALSPMQQWIARQSDVNKVEKVKDDFER